MAARDSIEEKIISRARTTGEELLEKAKLKQKALLQENTEELQQEIREILELEKKHIREKFQQDISGLRISERSKAHRLRRKIIDDVYENVRQKVTEKSNYRRYVENAVKQHAQERDALIVSAGEVDLFTNELKDILAQYKVTLADKTGRFRAGFIIPRGNVRLNCTLDESFKDLIYNEEIDVSAILFG